MVKHLNLLLWAFAMAQIRPTIIRPTIIIIPTTSNDPQPTTIPPRPTQPTIPPVVPTIVIPSTQPTTAPQQPQQPPQEPVQPVAPQSPINPQPSTTTAITTTEASTILSSSTTLTSPQTNWSDAPIPTSTDTASSQESNAGGQSPWIFIGIGIGVAVLGLGLFLFRLFYLKPSKSFRSRLAKNDLDEMLRNVFLGQPAQHMASVPPTQANGVNPEQVVPGIPEAQANHYSAEQTFAGEQYQDTYNQQNYSAATHQPDVYGNGNEVMGTDQTTETEVNSAVSQLAGHPQETGAVQSLNAPQQDYWMNTADVTSPTEDYVVVDPSGNASAKVGGATAVPQGEHIPVLGNPRPTSQQFAVQPNQPNLHYLPANPHYIVQPPQGMYYTTDGMTYQYVDPNQIVYVVPDGTPIVGQDVTDYAQPVVYPRNSPFGNVQPGRPSQ